MTKNIKVDIIGHGEAGSLIAGGLAAAGLAVVGFDVASPANPTVALTATIDEAVRGADIVLSINSSRVAAKIAEEVAPLLKAGALFADLNTGTPAMKKKMATVFPTASLSTSPSCAPFPALPRRSPWASPALEPQSSSSC